MKCFRPIYVKNPHFGTTDHVIDQRERLLVPCGRCYACKARRSSMWVARLLEESFDSKICFFVTLTYSDENLFLINGVPQVNKKHLQDFLKRFRYYNKAPFTYYSCGEYGKKTLRPHYHIIFFFKKLIDYNYLSECLHESWNFGNYQIDFNNERTMRYVCKYITKFTTERTKIYDLLQWSRFYEDDRKAKDNNPVIVLHDGIYNMPFSLMSKGMGKRYLPKDPDNPDNFNPFSAHHNLDNPYYRSPSGVRMPLPRYYRDKIYSEDDRKLINERLQEENYSYLLTSIDIDMILTDYTIKQQQETERAAVRRIKAKDKF